MIIRITGNVARMPDPNDQNDKFHFKSGDGKIGCRFSVVCGFGDRRYFKDILIWDREVLKDGEYPHPIKHAASRIMFEAGQGTQVSFDAYEEGDWMEPKQSSLRGRGWGRGGSSGGSTKPEYKGITYRPAGMVEIGHHTGERALLTAIRRNLDNETVKAMFAFLAEDDESTERVGPRFTYADDENPNAHYPPIWDQLIVVDELRQAAGETDGNDSSENFSGSRYNSGTKDTSGNDNSTSEEEIPF